MAIEIRWSCNGKYLNENHRTEKGGSRKIKRKGLRRFGHDQHSQTIFGEKFENGEINGDYRGNKTGFPSKGDIKINVNPIEQALSYESGGAAAISVLTDEVFFKGSIADLRIVSEAIRIPRLCKDFIIDEIQIDRAHQAGATIILLIVAALSKERLHELYQYAKRKGLEVLTEVHDEAELERALELNAELIGINNRNLKTFKVDLAVTERLAKLLDPKRHIIISESGIKTKKT